MDKKLQFWARLWRWAKTIFFVLTMLASLLVVCAPPLLIVLLDLLLPTSFLSTYFRSSSRLSATGLADQFRDFHFRSSLVDVPVVSAARSLIILCAYAACGGRGAYLGITTLCSFTSGCYVLVKSVVMLGVASGEWARRHRDFGEKGGAVAVEAIFLSSLALAVAHLVVAYRTSCRERRKLLVYRIDIEAESDSNFHSTPEWEWPNPFIAQSGFELRIDSFQSKTEGSPNERSEVKVSERLPA